MISSKKIAEQLYKHIENEKEPELFIGAFLDYIAKHSMMHMLPSVLFYLSAYNETYKKYSMPQCEFAISPLPETLKKVQKIIGTKENIVWSENKDLVGGFRAEYKGVIYDGSVQLYIERLRKSLSKM